MRGRFAIPMRRGQILCFLLALLAAAMPARAQEAPRAPAQTEVQVDATLAAIVRIRTRVVQGARTAQTLGSAREGTGVLVRDGYVATIGYLVIEAESIEVKLNDGRTVPATVAGYDHASGFALLRLLLPVDAKPLALGDADALAEGEPALVVRHGGGDGVALAFVVSRRPFSGSWEYQLDSAIYTVPAVPDWSGAALISTRGELVGIGSLVVNDAAGTGAQAAGNLFVPVSLLQPILDDLIAAGRRPGPARPWLGMNTEELRGRLLVSRVSPDGPAERAGLKSGDIVLGVGEEEVSSLGDFYAKVWARGAAGVAVPLKVLQGTQLRDILVQSIDRLEHFRQKPTY